MLFGSRNPIYLNMSFCGVLLVVFFFAFCWWLLQLRSEPMLGSSLFTALHLSLLQQPVLCRAVCAYSEISVHIGAVSLQMLLACRGRFCFTQELAAGHTSPCCVYLPGDSVRLPDLQFRGRGQVLTEIQKESFQLFFRWQHSGFPQWFACVMQQRTSPKSLT